MCFIWKQKNMKKRNNQFFQGWFTIVEILIAILLAVSAFLVAIQVFLHINVARIKILEKTQIAKEANYFVEKLFHEIKFWGTLDYEEYFNRYNFSTVTRSWHYEKPSGFWNFWHNGNISSSTYGTWIFFCRSSPGTMLQGTGCITENNSIGSSASWRMLRYGQYAFQFIDYNSDADDNSWRPGDENGDGDIRWDEDDEHLWLGPQAFPENTNVRELYLISADGRKRTYFRWKWERDPDAPSGYSCDGSASTFGSWCRGTIEMLKLKGSDEWFSHDGVWISANDGIIDTWRISDEFLSTSPSPIATGGSYRQDLFPPSLSVTLFEVYPYPNFPKQHAWKNPNISINVNPYVRIKMKIIPSWKKRKQIKGETPEIFISTTINLSDYLSY